VDTLKYGVDFASHIQQFLEQSRVVIAVMGENWIGRGSDGSIRIRDSDDWVRREIEIAVQQKIKILPVLVGASQMPSAADLPECLRSICTLNAAPLSTGRDFHVHMERLIQAIKI